MDHPRAAVQVVPLAGQSYPEEGECGFERPHRHDYHELFWSRRGTGSHLIDGERSSIGAATLTVIGRGQIHVLERAHGVDGALVRFGPEMLRVDTVTRVSPSWLIGFRGPLSVHVPDDDVAQFDALIVSLGKESARVVDSRSVDVQRHLVCTLLLWLERWHDAMQSVPREADDAAHRLYRRFTVLLEDNYAQRHDARGYADQLGVPQAVLSRALAEVAGRRTKELITERRMLEAARLLRFTDFTVGEIATRCGFRDQLYFSRAFKGFYGAAPTEYRNQSRGR